MSKFDEMIAQMKTLDYTEKKQFLEYLCRLAERSRHQFSQEDKTAVLGYVYEEVETMRRAIPDAANYREKDLIFACEDYLMGIVINLTGSPDKLPEDQFLKIKALAEQVNRERALETTLDSIFEQPSIAETDINRLMYWARQTRDEYQKSKLFLGLAHYRQELSRMDAGAMQAMTDYIASELQRLMTLDSEDTWNALELLADVSRHFADERVTAALMQLLQLGRNHIGFYAVDSLLSLGCEVPEGAIEALAKDLEYADLLYTTLQRAGKAHLFPSEFASEEYLAKSDLVHWLTYPTELGKVPDEIVYIGAVRKLLKKDVYHVFKFRSDSDTLDEERKNQWLVGWASDRGGTFSNFDEYAPFEQETPEKTLKLIKKKLIG